jgi:ABC-2 type transport system permease protein
MRAFWALSVAGIRFTLRHKITFFFVFIFPLAFITIFALLFTDASSGGNMIQTIAPGILSFSMANAAFATGALTIASWTGNGLLKRLWVTDAPAAAVLLSRYFVTVLIALAQCVIFLVFAGVVFGFTLASTAWKALPLVVLATFVFFVLGAILGMLAKTEQVTSSVSNLIMLALGFVSGTFIPLSVFPEWLQNVSLASPLRYVNEAVSARINDSATFFATATSPLVLIAMGFGATCVGIAMLRRSFR